MKHKKTWENNLLRSCIKYALAFCINKRMEIYKNEQYDEFNKIKEGKQSLE